jgi:hypothetical protein
VRDLLSDNGFSVEKVEGVRVFADLLPRGLDDREQVELLARLESHASDSDAYLDVAAQLHLHAVPA